jgi:hypothetical protein
MAQKTDNTTDKGKKTNNDLQSISRKTKERATRTPIKTGEELTCSTRDNSRLTVKRRKQYRTWKSR